MGIPLYFHKITNQYKNIVSAQSPQRCDRLFLDFNGIIHNVYNTIKTSYEQSVSQDTFEDILINEVILYMNKICVYVNPKQLLYICLDGVAPLPKIVQQRRRRYMSVWLKRNVKQDGYEWDSNAISPGTVFMNKMNNSLRKYVKENTFVYETILSDASLPGEGEHKIFDYIHFQQNTHCIDVIYGLDADLIMLSLICEKSKKFLLREHQHFHTKNPNHSSPFLWFNVELFKKNMLNYYNNNIDIHSYVFLNFMLGNDFLPTLSYLGIHNYGMDKILNAYFRVKDDQTSIVSIDEKDTYVINFHLLTQILDTLAEKEDNEMKMLHDNYYKKNMIFNTNRTKYDNYGIYKKNLKLSAMINQSQWRSNYYQSLFDMNSHSDNTIHDASKNYLEGLVWTANYYFNKKAPNNWFYRFNYSPTILDIYNFMEVQKKINYVTSHIEISSLEQLMLILPYQSKHLLPKTLQKVVDIDSPLGYFYPHDFHIETYLKHKLHECFPLLPSIDINMIQCAYLNTIS